MHGEHEEKTLHSSLVFWQLSCANLLVNHVRISLYLTSYALLFYQEVIRGWLQIDVKQGVQVFNQGRSNYTIAIPYTTLLVAGRGAFSIYLMFSTVYALYIYCI